MAPRPHAIPSVRCSARSRRTKQPCRNWAVVGATVCWLHNGKAPQVQRKALERLTLAELLRGDPRHPWQVVLDHMHTLDAVAREARLALGEDGAVTPQQLDRIVEYAKAAHHLAKTAIDVRAHEKLAESITRQVDLEGQVISEVVGATLDALLDRLTEAGLPAQRRDALRAWLFDVAGRQLQALDGQRPADLPPWPLADLRLAPVQRAQLEPAQTAADRRDRWTDELAAHRRPSNVDS